MNSGDQLCTTAAEPIRARPSLLPDIADILFVFLVGFIIFNLPNYLLGDGSTGWHLVTGKYILEHGQIPQHDLFSYTFPDKAWVPYEWLADLIGALLVAAGGIKLLAVSCATAIALLFALIYQQCRQYRCHFLVAAGLTLLGILISSVHWLARPHLFTFFALFLFCTYLERFRRNVESGKRLVLWLALTMVVWCNAHPAFLIGLAVVLIYLSSELVICAATDGEQRLQSWARAKVFAMALGVVFLCTLINPNAAHIYSYILNYLHSSSVLAATDEFMPPNFHELHAVLLAMLFGIFVFALAMSRKRPALVQILMTLAFGFLALTSKRNEPLFVIVSIPIIADLLAAADMGFLTAAAVFKPSAWFEKLTGSWQQVGQLVDAMEGDCTAHILPIVFTALLLGSCFFDGRIGPLELVTSRFGEDSKPIKTLQYAQDHKLNFARGFSLDNWGGYIAYASGQRVFIDDRLDFYGEPFFLQYGEVVQTKPGWQTVLDKNKIEWILFPKGTVLAQALEKSPDWTLLTQDQASVLYGRKR